MYHTLTNSSSSVVVAVSYLSVHAPNVHVYIGICLCYISLNKNKIPSHLSNSLSFWSPEFRVPDGSSRLHVVHEYDDRGRRWVAMAISVSYICSTSSNGMWWGCPVCVCGSLCLHVTLLLSGRGAITSSAGGIPTWYSDSTGVCEVVTVHMCQVCCGLAAVIVKWKLHVVSEFLWPLNTACVKI